MWKIISLITNFAYYNLRFVIFKVYCSMSHCKRVFDFIRGSLTGFAEKQTGFFFKEGDKRHEKQVCSVGLFCLYLDTATARSLRGLMMPVEAGGLLEISTTPGARATVGLSWFRLSYS